MPKHLIGQRVTTIETASARVVSVRRLGSAMIPNADTIIQEGDVVYVAAEIAALSQFDAGIASTQNGKGH
jgi:trk system potassium uptake protein TrkA